MNFPGKSMIMGIALAIAGTGAIAPAPAAAQVYGDGYYGGGRQDVGWRGDHYRGGDGWRGGYSDGRDWNRRDRDRRGWRGDRRWRGENRWRGNGGWRGSYRHRCWTEWRGGPYGRRAVRICR